MKWAVDLEVLVVLERPYLKKLREMSRFLKKKGQNWTIFKRVIVFYDANNNIAAAIANDATFNVDVQSVIGPWRPLIKIGGYFKKT